MKRIIRLTESDLARIVKRVIEEQTVPKWMSDVASKPKGQQVADSIKYAIKTASITNWWNKSDILDELRKLKTQADYNDCKKSLGNMKVYDYIQSNLKTLKYDRDTAGYVTNPLKGLGTGLTDEEFNAQMGKILSKFAQ
jgi:hypothetical protein